MIIVIEFFLCHGILFLIIGIRLHFFKFVKGLTEVSASKAQLGLGHSYSRCKVKFNVNRADNMIIQSINLLDQLDKDINTFSMRCRLAMFLACLNLIICHLWFFGYPFISYFGKRFCVNLGKCTAIHILSRVSNLLVFPTWKNYFTTSKQMIAGLSN